MALISMDAFDHGARRRPTRGGVPRQRNVVASFRVENAQTGKQPTEFGFRLLTEMKDVQLRAAGLARAADVSPATISRLIYGGVDRPDEATIGKIARALVEAGAGRSADPTAIEEAVQVKCAELLQASGYQGVSAVRPTFDPLVVDLQLMIGEGTPLDPGEVEFIRTMVGNLLGQYRKKMRRRAG